MMTMMMKIDHFGDVLLSQTLGLVLKKLNLTLSTEQPDVFVVGLCQCNIGE